MPNLAWFPINEAIRDGRPVWARGDNWGDPSKGKHCTWAYWNGTEWRAAGMDGSILLYLTHFMEYSDAARAEATKEPTP